MTHTIVLASTSARRKLLLDEAGIDHHAISPGIDDGELETNSQVHAAHWVAALAYMKARAGRVEAANKAPQASVVIGADTVVSKQGTVMGQPKDAPHAASMINALSNGSHDVLTGVALVAHNWRELFVDTSTVTVGTIPTEQIQRYVNSGEWQGKAGGYNLRDRVNAGWPIEVAGDPLSVMGLPVTRIVKSLEQHNIPLKHDRQEAL